MNQAFHLYRLQQIDSLIDQAASGLAEINRRLSGDEAVNQAQSQVDELGKLLHEHRQNLKQAEFAVHEQQIKIAQTEASLYSGKFHNPKELQDLQKEIVSLKKHLAVLEDHQLEAMMALEETENQHTSAQKNLTQALASFTERSSGWLGQKEQFTKTLERLNAERAASTSLITKESLQIYESMRKRKSGVAVTSVKDGSCAVCGATIRPSELQAARAAQDLVVCGSCGRILYSG